MFFLTFLNCQLWAFFTKHNKDYQVKEYVGGGVYNMIVRQQECKILCVGKPEEKRLYVILTVHFLTINISSNIRTLWYTIYDIC